MASGYEKSEDYGGKPPTKLGMLAIVIFMIVVSILFVRYIST